MKILIPCSTCSFPDEDGLQDFRLYSHSVNESGIYQFTCVHGHNATFVVQEEQFQMLFEISLNAIIDGYYRDAVASATAALERFYEFFTKVVWEAMEVPTLQGDEAWQAVAKSSERQLGMFISSHLMFDRTAPRLMKASGERPPSVEFRNAVIHKGRIPSFAEAKIYVQAVLDLIVPSLQVLRFRCPGILREFTYRRIEQRHGALGNDYRSSVTIGPTISILDSDEAFLPRTVEERLASISDFRGEHMTVSPSVWDDE